MSTHFVCLYGKTCVCRYRIGPFEVESALLEHPAVVESAVVSSPDTTRGEVSFSFTYT